MRIVIASVALRDQTAVDVAISVPLASAVLTSEPIVNSGKASSDLTSLVNPLETSGRC